MASSKKHSTDIAGVSLKSLTTDHPTPFYVYDQKKIEDQLASLIDFGTVRFATKALPNIAILSLMKSKGAVVDCVSLGEIKRAIAAGFNPKAEPAQIEYTCDIFDDESLDFIVKNNIEVNMGSADMIEQYANAGGKRPITLRINPGFGHGHSKKTNTGGPGSKHGIWHEDLAVVLDRVKDASLTIDGLHMHIGSGTDFEHLAKVCEAMIAIAKKIGPSLSKISAGGGLPIPYKEGDPTIDLNRYKKMWWEVKATLETEFGHDITLEVEPGRYLVAEAGYLVTKIHAVKHMGENKYYMVDAGFNNLARPAMYGSYHHMSVYSSSDTQNSETESTLVGGPLCESGDMFTQGEGGVIALRDLPKAYVGDYLVIHDAGAYGTAMGSNYNSKPHCAEILVKDGEAFLIRKQQRIEDLIEDEMIPKHLA